MSLTILGSKGFVLGEYVRQWYHHAVGNIKSLNDRNDYDVYSEDILYGISTIHNYHIFDQPHLDITTNLTTLVTVLENWKVWQEKNDKKGVFNFLSSWSVLGNQVGCLSVSESAPCNPKGWYIITKRCAEQLLECYCETFGLKYRILRLGNVVGPGDTKVSAQKNILQWNINLLANDKDVELFGDGNFYRDFIHCEDVSRAIELVLAKGEENSIYNIGNGYDPKKKNEVWPYRKILEFAKQELNSKGNIKYVQPTEFQKNVPVATLLLDNAKIRNLGYTPRYTEETLYKAVVEASKGPGYSNVSTLKATPIVTP